MLSTSLPTSSYKKPNQANQPTTTTEAPTSNPWPPFTCSSDAVTAAAGLGCSLELQFSEPPFVGFFVVLPALTG